MTLSDVAQSVGVSSITVSRAFRNPQLVADELRERILETASDMGYVSNRAASSLASARSMIIAVIVPSLGNSVFVEMLDGIDAVIRAGGYQMLLGINKYSAGEEQSLLESYLAFDPDGLLVTGFDHTEKTRLLLERTRVPVVHMMELRDRAETHCVGFSQEAAGEAMTRHLLARGRRRIGFVAAQLDPRTLARGNGYRAALAQAGLHDPRLEIRVPEPSSVAMGGALLVRLLEQAPDLDAVFFCNDDLAQGGLFECLRQGIDVPGRIAVAGFNDLPASACTMPALTTMATPRFEVGSQAAGMLLSLISGQAVASPRIDLGFELRARQST